MRICRSFRIVGVSAFVLNTKHKTDLFYITFKSETTGRKKFRPPPTSSPDVLVNCITMLNFATTFKIKVLLYTMTLKKTEFPILNLKHPSKLFLLSLVD
jgi:hypothetical protein